MDRLIDRWMGKMSSGEDNVSIMCFSLEKVDDGSKSIMNREFRECNFLEKVDDDSKARMDREFRKCPFPWFSRAVRTPSVPPCAGTLT
jgi:hypothetical protein